MVLNEWQTSMYGVACQDHNGTLKTEKNFFSRMKWKLGYFQLWLFYKSHCGFLSAETMEEIIEDWPDIG